MSARPPRRRPGMAASDAKDDPLAFPPFTAARRTRAELVAGILRSGRVVPDDAFDEIYPVAVKDASEAHWTPVGVCARILELLRLRPGAFLLDVGAGAGKFCIVAAAMSQVRVRGIERRPELAEVARQAARRLGVAVDIRDGTFGHDDDDLEEVDAAYFFNPFKETIPLTGAATEEPTASSVANSIAATEAFLDGARIGMRIVTYCGFGGVIPPSYERLASEVWNEGALELWEKRLGPIDVAHRDDIGVER